VGQRSNRKLGWIVLTAVALSAAVVDAATLNKRARLREGPSKETKLLGWVEDGTAVTIEGQRSGWYAVRAPDGQTGFVWQEHLRFEPGEAAAAPAVTTITTPPATTIAPSTALPATFPPTTLITTPTTRPPTTTTPRPSTPTTTLPAIPPTTLADIRPAPGERMDARPDANVAAELERLRGEVTRLAAAQQDLLQRLGRGGGTHDGGSAPAPPPMGSDGTAGAAVLFFGGGAVVGWLFGRFGPGRRERRTRLRL
jgi:uncharacterized protein YgiM (DUF1202 family)